MKIKEMVTKELMVGGSNATDEAIYGKVYSYLLNVCTKLPNDSREKHEFMEVVSRFRKDDGNNGRLVGSAADKVFILAIEFLAKKAIDARDDLQDFKLLRPLIVKAIENKGEVK